MRSFGRPLAVAFLSLALLATSALAHKDKTEDNDEQDGGGKPTPRAPEIDPGFLGSGAALLGGAMLIFRNRRRS
jgi:LPXTG-motif cell wall-anchored protein